MLQQYNAATVGAIPAIVESIFRLPGNVHTLNAAVSAAAPGALPGPKAALVGFAHSVRNYTLLVPLDDRERQQAFANIHAQLV